MASNVDDDFFCLKIFCFFAESKLNGYVFCINVNKMNCFKNIVFILFCFLLFTAAVLAQTNTTVNPNGLNRFFYPNGALASEGMYHNGQPDGYWKTYHVTGVLSSEGNRINSLLDSTWVFYTQTGDTLEIINYRLGKKTGFRYLYETVTQRNQLSTHYLKSKELYLDDKFEGPAIYYYPNGNIRQTINHRNGRRQGISRIFDENGAVITVEEYHNGVLIGLERINRVNEQGEKVGVWKTFYPNGTVMEEEFYKNGVLDGPTLVYSERTGNIISGRTYRDGTVVEEGAPIHAEPVELTTYWEDEVTIRRKGTYLDSIPIGRHYFYNRDGSPERSIRYSERATGIRTGEGPFDEEERRAGQWVLYSETGELRSNGMYVNDRQHGEWNFYYPDGTKQIGNFNNGVMEGEWKWFYPSGNIFREEIYLRGRRNGLCVQYSDSATIVAKGEYVNEEREGFWIEHVGHAREEGNYLMGLKNGTWKTYYLDGQSYHTGAFVQGVPDGRHAFYYPDGKTLKEEQYYVMGRRDKNWKKYYENGAIFLTITYSNDNEVRINGIRIDAGR